MRAATILAGLAASTLTAAVLAQPMPVGVYLIEPSASTNGIRGVKLSRDGQVFAGTDGATGAFRWTLANGRDNLNGADAPEFASPIALQALSPDGSTTLHIAPPAGEPNAAFAYRPGVGVQQYGPVSSIGRTERVHASNNASTVYATRFTNPQQFGIIRVPYRWTQATGWQDITPAPFFGSDWIETVDVSDDGSTWLGQNNGFVGTPGFFVSSASGVTTLGLAAGFGNPTARSINGPGTIVAGGITYDETVRERPAFWTNGVPTVLDAVGDYASSALSDISSDGSVGVGISRLSASGQAETAFVWTSTGGMKTLADFLDDYGLALPVGARVAEIQVSGDGTVIAGQWESFDGVQARGFVAVIPAPASVLIISGLFACAARRRR